MKKETDDINKHSFGGAGSALIPYKNEKINSGRIQKKMKLTRIALGARAPRYHIKKKIAIEDEKRNR